jgi:hypothetical protein
MHLVLWILYKVIKSTVEKADIVVLIVLANNPRNVLLINLHAGWK